MELLPPVGPAPIAAASARLSATAVALPATGPLLRRPALATSLLRPVRSLEPPPARPYPAPLRPDVASLRPYDWPARPSAAGRLGSAPYWPGPNYAPLLPAWLGPLKDRFILLIYAGLLTDVCYFHDYARYGDGVGYGRLGSGDGVGDGYWWWCCCRSRVH